MINEKGKGRYHDPSNPVAFMKLTRGDLFLGSMEFELFRHRVPITVDNFMGIIEGKNQYGLNYQNTLFHRIIGRFVASGGDLSEQKQTKKKSSFY